MTAFPYAAFRLESAEEVSGLIDAVRADRHQDEAHSGTLPPAAYLRPSFFALERDTLFKPGWIAIVHVSQLGDPIACVVDLFGERVAVQAGAGGVTATASSTGFEPRTVRTEVVDSFVYVNLTGDAAPLAPQVEPLSARFAKLRLDDLIPAFRMDYECSFNWKILVETFMECYHHMGAHTKTFEVDFPTRLAGVLDHSDLWTSGYSTARDEVPDGKLWTGLPLLSEDFTELERRSFFLYHIYPNFIIATMADRILWFRNQPGAANATSLQIFLFVRPEARSSPDFEDIMASERAFFIQVNDEDIAANDSQQLGLGSKVAEPGRFSHLEGSLWHFARYIRQTIGRPQGRP